jgi:uncharacterized protein DUF1707
MAVPRRLVAIVVDADKAGYDLHEAKTRHQAEARIDMKNDRLKLRASDGERQEVVDRLRAALDAGRLKMDEYLERTGIAYEAVTYGDLVALHADLPEERPIAKREASSPATAPDAGLARQGFLADLPTGLKVLWTIWLTAVSINVVVWALVSGTSGELIYPWPLWVAGPSGAALFAVSAGAGQIRRSRRAAALRVRARKG